MRYTEICWWRRRDGVLRLAWPFLSTPTDEAIGQSTAVVAPVTEVKLEMLTQCTGTSADESNVQRLGDFARLLEMRRHA